ncbi:hypothetical protein ABIF90_007290 [Bradyrhizobium japonicum]
MLRAAWPQVRDNLASTRREATVFLDGLEHIYGEIGGQSWAARWTSIGDVHCALGNLNIEKGGLNEATEAWLCALTAFEVARRLVDEGDPQARDLSTKVEAVIQRFGYLDRKVEPVQLACDDQSEFVAYYLPAGGRDLCAPAVICISSEEQTAATLLGRLLPVVLDRGLSILVVSHDDVSNHWRGQSEFLLSCCLDYLSARPDIDATRMGVYGEGLSAALATDFALSDRRIAAAVCDGGLWRSARTAASVGWITKTADAAAEEAVCADRLRSVRQLRCPILVVAGGRGLVSVSEAIKLQADCAGARIDLELAMPRMTPTPVGQIENFVTSDNSIFDWLEHKLAQTNHCR